MKKLKLGVAILGWLLAAFVWYAGRQVTIENDGLAEAAFQLQIRLSACDAARADEQTALAQCPERQRGI